MWIMKTKKDYSANVLNGGENKYTKHQFCLSTIIMIDRIQFFFKNAVGHPVTKLGTNRKSLIGGETQLLNNCSKT